MPQKQKRFTKGFEEEAVRLVRTSGRTKREIAGDLGVGVSTLMRWIAHSRDRQIDAAEQASPGENVAAELKSCAGRMRSSARNATS